MGWLTGPSEAKEVGAAAFLQPMDDALYPEPSFPNFADHAFGRNELVYACIMEKATSLPEAPLRVYAGDGIGPPRENHPLRLLMASPNPLLTEFEMLELTLIHLDLAGNAFWEVVRDRAGRPIALWPLRPDLVRVLPRGGNRVEYAYDLGSSRLVPLGEDVVHFKLPNPTDVHLGQPPLRPALRAVALDNEATDFVKALLQNKAVPGTVVETENAIDEEVTNRLTAKWIERFGGKRRGMPAFLQKGMKVHTLGMSPADLEFPDLRTISESRICMALGVPPILVGAKVGLDRSTFANYAEARRSFWEETLMPLQSRLQQTIVKKLLPMIETGARPRRITVHFDNSKVLALRESEGARWEQANAALRAGGITVNDFRRRVGLPTETGGDVYLRPAGVIPTDAAGNPTAAALLSQPPTQPVEEASAPLTLESKAVPEAQRKRFAGEVSAFAERQRDAVLADLEGSKSRLLALKAWDADRWDAELGEVLLAGISGFAYRAARKVDSGTDVSAMDAYLSVASANIATAWNESTRDAVAQASKISEWRLAVEHVFALAAGHRASTLATSLATEMTGFGAVDSAKRAGVGFKTWVVTSGNPRSEHAALDGERVPVDQTFSNGARWPGDSSLPDYERVNCSCDVIFEEGN